LEKIKECEIDSSLFWELSDDVLQNTLEIKIHGQRKQLLERMTEIKNAHEKEM